MNIDQVIKNLEAKKPITPTELEAFKATTGDKDATPYRRIQDALQILDEPATGPRTELLERLIAKIPVTAPAQSDEDDLIPAAPGAAHGDPTGEVGDTGVEGTDGEAGPPPPPASAGKGAVKKIDAGDIADAKAAAAQAIKEDQEENEATTADVRPPEVSEEEKQARIDEMARKEEEALKERADREKADAEAKEKADAEAEEQRLKDEADALAAAEEAKRIAEANESEEKTRFRKDALERHSIDKKLKDRILSYIKDGKTVAQLKSGSRRIFKMRPELGGSRAAQTNLGADLDFIWNDYL